MVMTVALLALTIVAIFVLLRLVAGKNRARDCYIRRDYEKFKRLDAQIEQWEKAIEPSDRQQHPDIMS